MSFAFKRHNSGDDDSGSFRPQLTSLVDVMTILLVFLIKSFSVEGNLDTPARDLELPVSVSEKPPEPRFAFAVTRNAIVFESEIIASLESVEQSDSMNVAPLATWIESRKVKMGITGPLHDLVIHVDREVEFSIVKKVLYTCSMAGFKDYSIMAISEK